MKQILGIHPVGGGHWVGNGFPVHTIFSYQNLGRELSPFLMLDHAGPTHFEPTTEQRGVDWHPHRGFETVTIVKAGEVEHEDSAGNAGRIGPGDVQWMTAGAGVLHKEMHGRDYARQGGPFEMLQFWVNLPAKHKLTSPRYQALLSGDIPVMELPDGAGNVRIVAGRWPGSGDADVVGPARTVTPVNLHEIQLKAGHRLALDLPEGYTGGLFITRGDLEVNGSATVGPLDLVVLDRRGRGVQLAARSDVMMYVMSGEPIDEPISGYGPFVMNTRAEIQQAINDIQTGRFVAA